MANNSDYNVKPFESFMDLSGNDRTLHCFYHGVHDPHLEARIMANPVSDHKLKVGVSLHPDDISNRCYDSERSSLDIWYSAPDPSEIRIALLKMELFEVPDSIREINVYDAKKR